MVADAAIEREERKISRGRASRKTVECGCRHDDEGRLALKERGLCKNEFRYPSCSGCRFFTQYHIVRITADA